MKKILPHLIAILSFLVITFIYLYPSFQDKSIYGGDTKNYAGMSKEAEDYNATHDDQALWTGAMFGGMPTYQISMEEKYSVADYIDKCLRVLPGPTYRVFLYLAGFYILLLCMGMNPYLAIGGAIAFAFGSYNLIIIVAGHNTKAVAIAYMAPILGSVIYAFRKNAWVGGALLALFLGLGLFANHVQIIYYTLILVICLGISELIFTIKEKTWKHFFATLGILCLGAIVAVGLNATRLLTTAEYVKATMRGESNGLTLSEGGKQHGLDFDYITAWSYGIDETMTLLIPNFMGGASTSYLDEHSHTGEAVHEITGLKYADRKLKDYEISRVERNPQNARSVAEFMHIFPVPTYHGDQPFTAGPVYVGAIVCFLFVLGLVLVPNRYKWWLLGATLLGILLSWGHNLEWFNRFFVNYVPMYNKFRTVSMTLTISCLAMCIMACLALKSWFDDSISDKHKKHALYIAGGITGGICLLFGIFPSLAGDFVSPNDASLGGVYSFLQQTLPADRADLLQADAWRSFGFIAGAFIILWLFSINKLPEKWAYVAMAFLFLGDMIPIAGRYLNADSFIENKARKSTYQPTLPEKDILQSDDPNFRVLNLTVDIFNTAMPSYFYKTVGGYSAVKMRRYQELIEVHLSKEIMALGQGLQQAKYNSDIDSVLQSLPVLNMLNTKYIIYSNQDHPLRNTFAMGNGWLVNQVQWAKNADEEMLALGTADLHTTAIIDEDQKELFQEAALTELHPEKGILLCKDYSSNAITYYFSSPEPQLAVFSEMYYYTGWNAYVNGEKLDHGRANYLLRAMPLPAGSYDIVFKFEPLSYQIGTILAIISSVLLTLALSCIIFVKFKQKK